jgi:heavy metal efflux system protein
VSPLFKLCVVFLLTYPSARNIRRKMLEKIIHLSIKNKLLVILAVLAIALTGIWAATRIPLDAVPDITNNQVQIITSCPSLATQEVEQNVTYPIEQSMATLPKLVEMRSISRFGLSVVTVVFTDETDIYFARQQISEHLKSAIEEIPAGVGTPELAPPTTGLGEIFQYVVRPTKGAEHKYNAMDLRTLQDWVVARQLYGTEGVAEVNSFGGLLKQYEVNINPNRLKDLNISIPDIFNALQENNENTGGAYIDKKPNAYFIRGIGTVSNIEDIGNIVVRANENGTPLLIKNVAEVKFGSAVRYGALNYNGIEEAVGGMVLMLKGANSFDVVSRVKEKIKTIQKSLPSDVVIEPYLDRTNLISRAIATVEKNLVEGALIVIFVLVLFLGNWRAGLIVASAIPLSMLFALLLMHIFGVSANLMSLGAIDFGLIVDGAVIIVEATMHYLVLKNIAPLTPKGEFDQAYSPLGGQGGDKILRGSISQTDMDDIVENSAKKMMNNAAFGQIIILIVYLPILSLEGIEGKMFRPMAQTVGFAIIGALLLSLTYIPVMCTWFLPKYATHGFAFSDKLIAYCQKIYTPILDFALKMKYAMVSVSVGLLLLSILIFSRLGGEFIPTLQEGDFNFDFILPQGASLSQTVETSMQASRIIRTFPEVKMVIGKTGTSEIPMDVMPTEGTDVIVILKDMDEWTTTDDYFDLGKQMVDKLNNIPGVFVEQSQPIQMRFNDLMTGVTQDVAVKIFGENLDTLAILADKVASIIEKVDGTGAPKVQRITGLPQITIQYDRQRMAQYGVNVKTLNQVVSTAFAGQKAGVVFENERRFDLVLRLDSAYRSSIQNVADLYVPLSNGNQIPLSQVAQIDFKEGPAEIGREDGKRRVVIGFNLKGRDVQSVVEELQNKLEKQVKLPTGYYFTYGGAFENLQKATNRLLIALPLALVLIFILLYFTFHSAQQAALIFTAIPMSAIGGVFALLLRGMPFSISAGVGFIALFGVAVLNGIVLIGTFNDLAAQGYDDIVARVKEGTKIRLRPVLMTATVASLGFLPMALSNGAGAEVQKPLATVVIGGLITATFLTLVVLPLLYIIFSGKKISLSKMPISSVLLLFFLIFSINNTFSQKSMGVEEAIQIGLKNNLSLKINDAQIAKANAQTKAATSLPKTGVFIENEDLRPSDSRGILKIGISQAIDFPTVYGSKRQFATEQAKYAGMQRQLTEAELKRDIRHTYYQLWYLWDKKMRYLQLDTLYAALANAAELRQKTGESTGLERIAAQAQHGELKAQITQILRDIEVEQTELKQLLNYDFSIVPISNYLLKMDTPLSILSNIKGKNDVSHPLLDLQKQQLTIAEAEQKLQKKQNLPDLSGRFFSQRLYGLDNPFNGFSVSVGVPLMSKGLKKTEVANMEIAVQKQALAQQNQALSTLQQQAQMQVGKAKTALDFYEKTGLQQAQEIMDAATLAYKSGDISYADMAQYIAKAIALRTHYVDSLNDHNQAVIGLLFYFNL